MTPAEIIRVAKARAKKEAEGYKNYISAAYLNATLQRRKIIPPLDQIIKTNTGQQEPPSLASIVAGIRAAHQSSKQNE